MTKDKYLPMHEEYIAIGVTELYGIHCPDWLVMSDDERREEARATAWLEVEAELEFPPLVVTPPPHVDKPEKVLVWADRMRTSAVMDICLMFADAIDGLNDPGVSPVDDKLADALVNALRQLLAKYDGQTDAELWMMQYGMAGAVEAQQVIEGVRRSVTQRVALEQQ